MRTDDLDFVLPPELIAQVPAPERTESRLLHYRRSGGEVGERGVGGAGGEGNLIAHRQFSDLPNLLREGDLLVFNDARVAPAKISFKKTTGGRIEGLFLADRGDGRWSVLLRSLGPKWNGIVLDLLGVRGVTVVVVQKGEGGEYLLEVSRDGQPVADATPVLEEAGRMPLPPYIRREKDIDERDNFDRERYQTVYAAAPGSVAAPTAGLHFSQNLLSAIAARGIFSTHVTLDVGIGTFRPVTVDHLIDHPMHEERWTLPGRSAEMINLAKREGRRVIAVGTTAARVLEAQPPGELTPGSGSTSIFIYPPYGWKHVGALITNFHLPRSTLIALVASFVGLDEQRRIYREAVARGYRFFSYGDASFLE